MKLKIMSILGLFALGFTAAHGEQLKMNGKLKIKALSQDEVCYTGKPYSKELGAYVFNYRNFDPVISRWTTSDPSGFPNSANNHIYGNNPTMGVDSDGLIWKVKITSIMDFSGAGWSDVATMEPLGIS